MPLKRVAFIAENIRLGNEMRATNTLVTDKKKIMTLTRQQKNKIKNIFFPTVNIIFHGAMTLSITTLSITTLSTMTFSIMALYGTLSITALF